MGRDNDCKYEKEVPVLTTRKCLTPLQILNTFQDAVVKIEARFLLLGEDVTSAADVPPSVNQRADIVIRSTGWIHSSGHIVCPASAVVAPPAITAVANLAGKIEDLGQIKEFPYTASQILVTVNNVNGGAISYIYLAELQGYYGRGDFAILNICDDVSFNRGSPYLNVTGRFNYCCDNPRHVSLKGVDYLRGCCDRRGGKCGGGGCYDECSASTRPGDKVYLLGYGVIDAIDGVQATTSCTLIEGTVAEVRHTEKTGWFTPECLVIAATSYNFAVGMPVLNSYGRVVGMQTADYQDQFPLAGEAGQLLAISWPSIYVPMQSIIKNINESRKLSSNVVRLPAATGRVSNRSSLYSGGYLGISYQVFDGGDYTMDRDYTSGNAAAGKPEFRLNANGSFSVGTDCKDIQGILVTGVAGINPNGISGVEDGYWFVPGGVTTPQGIEAVSLFPSGPVSSLLGLVEPGDIIVTLESIGKSKGDITQFYFGSLDGQVNPQIALDRFSPGDLVRITFRKKKDGYTEAHAAEVILGRQPAWLNYPHYATARFPDLGGGAFIAGVQDLALASYPAFRFPLGLSVGIDFQTPTRNAPGSAVFAPSI